MGGRFFIMVWGGGRFCKNGGGGGIDFFLIGWSGPVEVVNFSIPKVLSLL